MSEYIGIFCELFLRYEETKEFGVVDTLMGLSFITLSIDMAIMSVSIT